MVVVEKPKRSPFLTLAYATAALVVLNLPYFLYQANAEPTPDPFAAMGKGFILLICFGPLSIASLIIWWAAVVKIIIQLVNSASVRR